MGGKKVSGKKLIFSHGVFMENVLSTTLCESVVQQLPYSRLLALSLSMNVLCELRDKMKIAVFMLR
jgi:hypothetical protein